MSRPPLDGFSSRRSRHLVAGLAALCLSVSACGNGEARVTQPEFERRLVEQEGLTTDEASCVGRYVYDAYDPVEIRVIHDAGITKLPSPRWAEFGHAMLACAIHDEVVAPPDPASAPAAPDRSMDGP